MGTDTFLSPALCQVRGWANRIHAHQEPISRRADSSRPVSQRTKTSRMPTSIAWVIRWRRRSSSKCKAFTPDPQTFAFDYSHSGKKISILEPLIGKSGFMRVVCQTMTALETEDFVLLSGVCDDGTPVDAGAVPTILFAWRFRTAVVVQLLPEHLRAQIERTVAESAERNRRKAN